MSPCPSHGRRLCERRRHCAAAIQPEPFTVSVQQQSLRRRLCAESCHSTGGSRRELHKTERASQSGSVGFRLCSRTDEHRYPRSRVARRRTILACPSSVIKRPHWRKHLGVKKVTDQTPIILGQPKKPDASAGSEMRRAEWKTEGDSLPPKKRLQLVCLPVLLRLHLNFDIYSLPQSSRSPTETLGPQLILPALTSWAYSPPKNSRHHLSFRSKMRQKKRTMGRRLVKNRYQDV